MPAHHSDSTAAAAVAIASLPPASPTLDPCPSVRPSACPRAKGEPASAMPSPSPSAPADAPVEAGEDARAADFGTDTGKLTPPLEPKTEDELDLDRIASPFGDDYPSDDPCDLDDPAEVVFRQRFKPMTDPALIIDLLTKQAPSDRDTDTLYRLAGAAQRILCAWQDEYLKIDGDMVGFGHPTKKPTTGGRIPVDQDLYESLKEADLYNYAYDYRKGPGNQNPAAQRLDSDSKKSRRIRQRRQTNTVTSDSRAQPRNLSIFPDESQTSELGKRKRRAAVSKNETTVEQPSRKRARAQPAQSAATVRSGKAQAGEAEPASKRRRGRPPGKASAALVHQRVQQMLEDEGLSRVPTPSSQSEPSGQASEGSSGQSGAASGNEGSGVAGPKATEKTAGTRKAGPKNGRKGKSAASSSKASGNPVVEGVSQPGPAHVESSQGQKRKASPGVGSSAAGQTDSRARKVQKVGSENESTSMPPPSWIPRQPLLRSNPEESRPFVVKSDSKCLIVSLPNYYPHVTIPAGAGMKDAAVGTAGPRSSSREQEQGQSQTMDENQPGRAGTTRSSAVPAGEERQFSLTSSALTQMEAPFDRPAMTDSYRPKNHPFMPKSQHHSPVSGPRGYGPSVGQYSDPMKLGRPPSSVSGLAGIPFSGGQMMPGGAGMHPSHGGGGHVQSAGQPLARPNMERRY